MYFQVELISAFTYIHVWDLSGLQDTCGEGQASGSLEESVAAHAFDIIFMLDELISGGYREALTLQQIQSFVAMDSHEEKLQKMIAEVIQENVTATRTALSRGVQLPSLWLSWS